VSLMATAIRALMGNGANFHQIALALVAPVLLTLTLAPMTLWLYRKQ
jgi:ABC-2 type transport system permease protein